MGNKDSLKETMLEFLSSHNTMSLATSMEDSPFAASLFYANDGFTIYFISSLKSQHSMNLSLNPNVAITINKDHSEWRMIKGLQIRGKAYRVSKEELPMAVSVYSGKYPFIRLILGDSCFPSKDSDIQFFVAIPERIRLINNEIAFGYKVEIQL